jgi:hypothetical protein
MRTPLPQVQRHPARDWWSLKVFSFFGRQMSSHLDVIQKAFQIVSLLIPLPLFTSCIWGIGLFYFIKTFFKRKFIFANKRDAYRAKFAIFFSRMNHIHIIWKRKFCPNTCKTESEGRGGYNKTRFSFVSSGQKTELKLIKMIIEVKI